MAGFGELLYSMAKAMGDYNAVKKGNLGQRVGRRAAGKPPARPCGSCSSNGSTWPCVSGPAMQFRRHFADIR